MFSEVWRCLDAQREDVCMTNEIAVICDGCMRPIGGGLGWLWVDMAEIGRYREAVRAWEAEVRGDASDDELLAMTSEQFLAGPHAVRWQAHHADCDPKINANAYSVVVERIRTWPDLVSLTADLMGKSWLSATDWSAVLEAAARAEGTRVCPVG